MPLQEAQGGREGYTSLARVYVTAVTQRKEQDGNVRKGEAEVQRMKRRRVDETKGPSESSFTTCLREGGRGVSTLMRMEENRRVGERRGETELRRTFECLQAEKRSTRRDRRR